MLSCFAASRPGDSSNSVSQDLLLCKIMDEDEINKETTNEIREELVTLTFLLKLNPDFYNPT